MIILSVAWILALVLPMVKLSQAKSQNDWVSDIQLVNSHLFIAVRFSAYLLLLHLCYFTKTTSALSEPSTKCRSARCSKEICAAPAECPPLCVIISLKAFRKMWFSLEHCPSAAPQQAAWLLLCTHQQLCQPVLCCLLTCDEAGTGTWNHRTGNTASNSAAAQYSVSLNWHRNGTLHVNMRLLWLRRHLAELGHLNCELVCRVSHPNSISFIVFTCPLLVACWFMTISPIIFHQVRPVSCLTKISILFLLSQLDRSKGGCRRSIKITYLPSNPEVIDDLQEEQWNSFRSLCFQFDCIYNKSVGVLTDRLTCATTCWHGVNIWSGPTSPAFQNDHIHADLVEACGRHCIVVGHSILISQDTPSACNPSVAPFALV